MNVVRAFLRPASLLTHLCHQLVLLLNVWRQSKKQELPFRERKTEKRRTDGRGNLLVPQENDATLGYKDGEISDSALIREKVGQLEGGELGAYGRSQICSSVFLKGGRRLEGRGVCLNRDGHGWV